MAVRRRGNGAAPQVPLPRLHSEILAGPLTRAMTALGASPFGLHKWGQLTTRRTTTRGSSYQRAHDLASACWFFRVQP
ncbi:hypothetical protein AWC26_08895 [Mycobacterium shimoidei]|nr:hypothetical protein BHQ16_03995 [Mycobacterium shimoidei]ORW80973.1 hypothetical protein AWC26_08895 [Mycobacterium shimoidei]